MKRREVTQTKEAAVSHCSSGVVMEYVVCLKKQFSEGLGFQLQPPQMLFHLHN
jgi:hypothetical protein